MNTNNDIIAIPISNFETQILDEMFKIVADSSKNNIEVMIKVAYLRGYFDGVFCASYELTGSSDAQTTVHLALDDFKFIEQQLTQYINSSYADEQSKATALDLASRISGNLGRI